MVFYIIESMILVFFIVFGVKFGLINLIIVIVLYILNNKKDVFLIILLWLLLLIIFNGSLFIFMYGVVGVIFSYYVMIFVKKFGKGRVSIVGVSCFGVVFYNIG